MRQMQIEHGGPGLGARVVLTGVILISGTLLASGCSSSGSSTPAAAPGSASAPAPAVSSGSSAPAPSGPAASPQPSGPATSATSASSATSAAASPSVNPGGTEAGTQTCAQKARDAFIHVTKVVSAAGGGLTVTGSKAALVCGGPDDSHFNVASGTETGYVQPGANIEVFPVSKMAQEKIAVSKLASYLATDDDTRIFLIGGSLSAISSLQEQFHP